MSLTKMQRNFVQEYAKDHNATHAAIRAGYEKNSAHVTGCRLLATPEIKRELTEFERSLLEKCGITNEMIVNELKRMAFSNMGDLAKWGPAGVSFRNSEELDEGVKAAVAEVSQTYSASGGSVKLKAHDKLSSLKFLAEMAGLASSGASTPGTIEIDLTIVSRGDADGSSGQAAGESGSG